MIREFLEKYESAMNLDDSQYDTVFKKIVVNKVVDKNGVVKEVIVENSIKKSDFLLFDSQIICEVKEIQNIKVSHQVEKLARKDNLSVQNFRRDLYNSINLALSKANRQIEESKNALKLSDALGLVILENLIQSDLSVLSLIDAAQRKMLGGLEHVDGVLCLDMVNTFSGSEGKRVRPTQLLMRDTERSARLGKFLQQLMSDFCAHSDTPLYNKFTIGTGEQVWQTNQDGKYQAYKAKFDQQTLVSKVKIDWKKQIVKFLDKWWWVIPLPVILYDWFIS